MPDVKTGALVSNQYTDLPVLLAAGKVAKELGFDSVMFIATMFDP